MGYGRDGWVTVDGIKYGRVGVSKETMVGIRITDIEDPRLAPFRDLKQASKTRWSRKIITEGWRVTERLLASDWPVEAVLVSERRLETFGDRFPADVPVWIVPQKIAEALVGFNFHAGVLGLASPPERRSLEAWAGNDERDCVVAFPRVVDPENVGLIMRSAAAFGIRRLLIGGHSANPYSRRALRLSMGAALHLSIHETSQFEQDLAWLIEQRGYRATAAVCSPTAIPLPDYVRPPRCVLVVGNESEGLSEATLARCHDQVTIPMHAAVESLNVAMATSLFLYELGEVGTS